MMPAANLVALAVGPHHVVIGSHKRREILEKMTGKPRERLGLTDGAQWNFQVRTAPAALEGAAGGDEALAQQRRAFRLAASLCPKIIEKGIEGPVVPMRGDGF